MIDNHGVEDTPEVAELVWDGNSLTSFVEGYVVLLEELGGQELSPSQIINPSNDSSTLLAREIAEELGKPIAAAISEGRVKQVAIEQWCSGLRLLERTSGELRQELQRIHAINRLGRLALQSGLTAFMDLGQSKTKAYKLNPMLMMEILIKVPRTKIQRPLLQLNWLLKWIGMLKYNKVSMRMVDLCI